MCVVDKLNSADVYDKTYDDFFSLIEANTAEERKQMIEFFSCLGGNTPQKCGQLIKSYSEGYLCEGISKDWLLI